MTTRHSWKSSEAHFSQHSAFHIREPPINDSPVLTSDEGDMSHGGRIDGVIQSKQNKRILFN